MHIEKEFANGVLAVLVGLCVIACVVALVRKKYIYWRLFGMLFGCIFLSAGILCLFTDMPMRQPMGPRVFNGLLELLLGGWAVWTSMFKTASELSASFGKSKPK